jgi:O-antigen ligase
MLALMIMAALLVGGIRWQGLLLAGILFTYQAHTLSQFSGLGETFAAAALVISIARAAAEQRFPRLGWLDAVFLSMCLWFCLSPIYSTTSTDSFSWVEGLLASSSLYFVGRLADPQRYRRTIVEMLIGLEMAGALLGTQLVHAARAMQMDRLALGESSAVGLSQTLPYEFVAAVICTILGASLKRLPLLAVSLLCLAVIGFTSVASATRGVFIADAAALAVFLWCYRRQISPSRWAFLSPVLAVAVVLFLSKIATDRNVATAIQRLLQNFVSREQDLSSLGRLEAFTTAIQMFTSHPILGAGMGSFNDVRPDLGYPHNLFLEIAAEFGLVGLGLLLAYLCVLIARADLVRKKLDPLMGSVLLAFLAAALVHQQLSFAFIMARPLFLLTGMTAAFASQVLSQRSAQWTRWLAAPAGSRASNWRAPARPAAPRARLPSG